MPAPESDRLPRCCRCQSVMDPSTALYWHIAAIAMRLESSMRPIDSGVNSLLVITHSKIGDRPRLFPEKSGSVPDYFSEIGVCPRFSRISEETDRAPPQVIERQKHDQRHERQR